jgi:hypothetical protein
MNTQNNRHWHAGNIHFIHVITVHDVKVGIWFIQGNVIYIPKIRYMNLLHFSLGQQPTDQETWQLTLFVLGRKAVYSMLVRQHRTLAVQFCAYEYKTQLLLLFQHIYSCDDSLCNLI